MTARRSSLAAVVLTTATSMDERDLVTNQALRALGMASRAGADVPDKTWADGCRYLVHSANEGHVGRSLRDGFDRRSEAARCAGAAAALFAINCVPTDPHLIALVGHQMERGAEVARARRAPALGVLNAALVARQLGGPVWAEFCRAFSHLLIGVTRRDGSCHWLPRGGAEPLPFEGATFDTACVALVLALQHDRARVRLAAHGPADQPKRDSTGAIVPGTAAAPPPGTPAIPPGGQVIQLPAGEDLREQLEKLGISEEQIEKIEKQVPAKAKKQ